MSKPEITADMKREFIGEFSFNRETVYESGDLATEEILVPWTVIKDIYKRMTVYAAEQKVKK